MGGGVNRGRIGRRSRIGNDFTARSRGAGLLVEAAAQLDSLEVGEQAAMLLGNAGRLADRGGRRTGRGFYNRAGCWCTGASLLVASLSIANQDQ